MYEGLGLQFFRTTTEIQSEANAFDESRFLVTFLIILEVTAILCSFGLVPGGKTYKEILESSRLEFLEKILSHSFALSDSEDNSYSPKVSRAEFLGSDKLFCFSKHIQAFPLHEPICND